VDAWGEVTASVAVGIESRNCLLLVYRLTGPYVSEIAFDADDLDELKRHADESIIYPVAIDWTPCNYGGERPWFLCPGRGYGRHAVKLYLGNPHFLCRRCYQLRYACQLEHEDDRLFRRRAKIAQRLGGDDSGLLPSRPKGMHTTT
jgi:hypothetical protein